MNDYNMEQYPPSQGLSQTIYISRNLSLIELDSNSHQHIQLCGYSQRGSPLCELLRNVNTSTTVTGTIIYLGSVLHWCKALCVCDAASYW